MVNVGIAGLGMMGVTHYRAWDAIIDARFGRESLAVVFEEAKSIRSGKVVELT